MSAVSTLSKRSATGLTISNFFCADVTTINPNVMYEVGFAIARDKRVWLIRDDSYVDSRVEFDQLRFLTTVGYRPYTNAEQIIKGFFAAVAALKSRMGDTYFATFSAFKCKTIALKSRTFVVNPRTEFAAKIARDLSAKVATIRDSGRDRLERKPLSTLPSDTGSMRFPLRSTLSAF
jgi:hypothetical protein